MAEDIDRNQEEEMEQAVKIAVNSGFHHAVWIDSKELIFDAALRKYCEENLCGIMERTMPVHRIAGLRLTWKKE